MAASDPVDGFGIESRQWYLPLRQLTSPVLMIANSPGFIPVGEVSAINAATLE
jgi:hypothetical protein